MNVRASLALTPAEQERLGQVRSFGQAGPAGIESLLALLSEPSWAVRRAVVAALAELGAASVGPLCAILRTERDDEARISAAVDALVQNEVEVLGEVAALARDAEPAVAADAAQILGRRRQPRAVPILTALVTHRDDNVAVAAIEALGRIGGPSAVETLVDAVQSGNFFRVFPAIDVLGRSGDPRAIGPLAELLRNPMYLLEAARALGKTAQAAAVVPLATLLSHPSEATLRVATLALAELHLRHRERYGSDEAPAVVLRKTGLGADAVPRLVRSLSNAAPEEREATAVILGVVGGNDAAAALSGLLEPADAPAALAAASALERLGRDSDLHIGQALREGNSLRRRVLLPIINRASVAAEVTACLTDGDALVRSLACDALARAAAVEQVPALFPLLADPNARVVQAAIAAIQSLGGAQTRELALAAARAGDPAVRRSALRILGYLGYPEALPIFVEALSDGDPRLAELALSGLAYLDLPRALEVLLTAAESPLERTRRASLRALGLVPRTDPRVSGRVLAAFTDRDAWVRYYACQAAGKLALSEATPAIVKLLDDEAGQVRVAAVEALSHLQNDLALEALCRLAEGQEPDLCRAALIGLGIAKRPEGVSRLLAATQSNDPATRLVAISALAETGAPERVAALARAAEDADENVRAAALGFLSTEADPAATHILLDLVPATGDPGRIGVLLARASAGRVRGLSSRLASTDEEGANLCCSLLARLRSPEATLALLETLSQGELVARKAAAVALASLRTPDALAAVRHAAGRDPDARVRQICSILLSH
ncbi:MAG: HEAT repeat domain-containing protein [Deltaproteobacteria bacterium]